MKKSLLLVLLASATLFSCKKENKKPSATKYPVHFTVSGFSEQIVSVAHGNKQLGSFESDVAAGLASAIDQLDYFAYDSSGKFISSIRQDSTFSNFGSIDDYLAPGTYTIVIGGSKGGAVYTAGTSYDGGSITATTSWGDTFFQEFSLTVGTQAISQNVNLKRIVGELSVLVTDQIPATASTLSINVSSEAFRYNFLEQVPSTFFSNTYTFQIPASAIGTSNFKQSIIMLNTTAPFTAVISCADASGKILAQSTVSNVTLQQNTETILSGALFSSNTVFALALNQAWNSTPINIKF